MKLTNQGTDEPVLRALDMLNPIDCETVYEYLSKDGLGIDINAAANFATVTSFIVKVPATKKYNIARILTGLSFSAAPKASFYGSVNLAADKGIEIKKYGTVDSIPDVLIQDYTKGVKIDSFGAWANFCYDVRNSDFGNLDNFQTARVDMYAGNSMCCIDGSKGQYLSFEIIGDFSGLTKHHFHTQIFATDI